MGIFFSDSKKIERSKVDKILKDAGVHEHVRRRFVEHFEQKDSKHIDKKEFDKAVKHLTNDSSDGISSQDLDHGIQTLSDRINDLNSQQ